MIGVKRLKKKSVSFFVLIVNLESFPVNLLTFPLSGAYFSVSFFHSVILSRLPVIQAWREKMVRTILVAMLCLSAVTANAGKSTITLEYNRQRPGGDYTHYYLDSAAECARDCEKSSRCRAFDYYERDRSCWLKSVAYGSRRYVGVISGKKRTAASRKSGRRGPMEIVLNYDTQRPGGDYTRFWTQNARQCSRECSRQARCAAFDYTTSDSFCYLKSWVPAARGYPGIISGVKRHIDPEVRSLQRVLAAEGYRPGPVDGLMGRRTRIALENYQEEHGLAVTGRINDSTLIAMGLQQKESQAAEKTAPALSSLPDNSKESVPDKTVKVFVKTAGVTYLQRSDNIHAAILDKIPAGTILEVLSENSEWYRVSYGGQEGYILAEAVEKQ
jgi:hypothetical protein